MGELGQQARFRAARASPFVGGRGRSSRDGTRFALVRGLPDPGRQHQLRVPAQRPGIPLVGDTMYGPAPGDFARRSRDCLERRALQAAVVAAFEYPHTRRR